MRIDQHLVKNDLVNSRSQALELIKSGKVSIMLDGKAKVISKPSTPIEEGAEINIKNDIPFYVSRSALKLKHAIKKFDIDVQDKICMDIGASTGGFTEILLQNNAKKIYAIDVGHDQLDSKIASDERVVSIEDCNARDMPDTTIPEKVDLIVMDVSFISVKKIIPNMIQFLKPNSEMLVLIKPQFEVGKERVVHGIVKSKALHQKAIKEIQAFCVEHKLNPKEYVAAPITGKKGNQEYIMWIKN